MELLCDKTQRPKHVDCFPQKSASQTSDQILNADLTRSASNVGCGWNASAWRRKWLRLYETINKKSNFWYWNPACGDSNGSIRLKRSGSCISWICLRKTGEGAVQFSVLEHLWMIGLMVVMLMSYVRGVSVVLVLLGVGIVLRRYGVERQKVSWIVSGHFRNLILAID